MYKSVAGNAKTDTPASRIATANVSNSEGVKAASLVMCPRQTRPCQPRLTVSSI